MAPDIEKQFIDNASANGSTAVQAIEAQPGHYVGIGASAGGLEAIEAFVKNLPARTGLAFIVVQHLSPDYKSMMVELLSKRTRMSVRRAENGMPVQADTIYLIPPKKHLTIFHGKLILSDPERSRSGIFLPIDIFLRSLADDQGDKAVGIILSGTGSDGMRGVRAIKESGGMVMVQEESTAKFDGMPRSAISTGMADFILPPEDMPGQLLAFAKGPQQSRSARSETILTDEDGLARIFSLLRERHKIDFTYYKPSTVVRRVERRMTVNHINELCDYVKFLESYPRELSVLYRELLIGVTSFFRDPEAFEALAQKHLPALFDRVQDPLLRFWVAGCSTGEEAYTLAMICRQCLDSMGISLDIKIFATDVDRDAIGFASNGVYPESIAADLTPAYLSKYFLRKDDCFQISRDIRTMVVFAQHNLIKDPPFTNIDLVTCRNLLIYLQPVLQRKVMEYFNFSLNPEGLLFLGHSETTGEMADCFTPLNHKWKIYQSRGKSAASISDLEIANARFTTGRLLRPHFLGPQKAMRLHEEERILDRLLDTLAGDYVPLTMVVNDQMELLHVLGDATGILGYPSGRVVNDISKVAVKELSIPISTGIQKAFKHKEEVRYTNIHIRQKDETRSLDMRIRPFRQRKGQVPLAAVIIDQAERYKCLTADQDASVYDVDKEAAQHIQDLEQELQFIRENLQATIEELETSNEELQATNEELLASNEELQSTNEELQSVNEELHTVNTEHQRKIMELTELNNDIRNLMESTEVGTLFLDENLEIRKFTPPMAKIFKIVESDAGRPVSHLVHHLQEIDLLADIETARAENRTLEKEVHTEEEYWYRMRIQPYLIGAKTASGLVLTFVDIDDLKKSQFSLLDSKQALEVSESKFKLLAENIADVFWIRTPDCSRTEYISPAYERIWGRDSQALYKDPEDFIQAIHPDDRGLVREQLKSHTQGVWDVEYRIMRARDGIIWIHDRGFPVRDEKGRLTLMCGFASDVTASKTREMICQASVSNFRKTFETASVGIVMIDNNGYMMDSNPTLQAMLGYSGEELRRIRFHMLIHPDDAADDLASGPNAELGKRDFYHLNKRLIDKAGGALHVFLTLITICNTGGKPNYTIGLVEKMADADLG